MGVMAAAMACRGPDDEGFLCSGNVGLAHRRLSIIDLAGGHQPISNEDGSCILVCNGEIYGYATMRRELERGGHSFRSNSDSEVLLHLYEEMGELCLDRLNGMFAFAIADLAKGEFFVARDRFGQKPLFYAEAPGRFAFASGPAALGALPWVDLGLDCTAIHDLLEYQYIPRPRSIYRGVFKLPPGCFLRYRWESKGAKWVSPTGPPQSCEGLSAAGPTRTAGATAGDTQSQAQVSTYWSPDLLPGFGGTLTDAAREVSELLSRSVSQRLVADVPLGAFLSGGMDSSIICALAQDELIKDGHPLLKTFSIGFPVAGYDERAYSEAVARHLGTDHHFMEVNPADFARLSDVVAAFEEPFADASMLPTYLLSRFTREHVTVALSGDGADELFGGYYRYRFMHLCRWLCLAPTALRRAIQAALLALLPAKTEERTFRGRIRRMVELLDIDGLERYLGVISRFPEALRRSLYTEAMLDSTRGYVGAGFLLENMPEWGMETNRIMELDCRTYLPEDILVKVDRSSMAHALEVRSPFLDVEVAEFALALPYGFKQRGRRRKRVLAAAFADRLPGDILRRPKMGFGLPVAHWFRNEWRSPASELLLSGVLDDYFRRDRLEWFIKEHVESKADYSYGLFALTVLALWLSER